MEWHSISARQTASELKSNIENGLSEQFAKQLLNKHGENKLNSKPKPSVIKKFFAQFSDFCVIILFIACIISFVTSLIEGEHDFIEPIVILFIVSFPLPK